jgi:divalent metal cation (Fe/Co/Zn/Cd) transporter
VADVRLVRSRGTPSGVIFAEVTVGVDGRMSVTDGHAVADEVERRMKVELGDSEVTVHVEPS